MFKAAREFFDELGEDKQRRALFPMDHDERFNWNYVPCERQGIPFREMTEAQREAAHGLLRSALSDAGYRKSVDIMRLEGILREVEGRDPEDTYRDPDGYFITLYGDLSPGAPWGWRVDGHHVSLTFSSVTQELVASTPAFWGANPAEVPHGQHKGWRILQQEEDLARALLEDLAPEQQAQAVISKTAPRDIVTRTDREVQIGDPAGLPASDMTEDQRGRLLRLLSVYLANFRPDLAEGHRERVRRAGVEKLTFAWAGGFRRRQKHYYRIHGPTLLIEYDNTQNDANHIHTVVRDLEHDFGIDWLRKHYEESEHHR